MLGKRLRMLGYVENLLCGRDWNVVPIIGNSRGPIPDEYVWNLLLEVGPNLLEVLIDKRHLAVNIFHVFCYQLRFASLSHVGAPVTAGDSATTGLGQSG